MKNKIMKKTILFALLLVLSSCDVQSVMESKEEKAKYKPIENCYGKTICRIYTKNTENSEIVFTDSSRIVIHSYDPMARNKTILDVKYKSDK
jgi:hypothetical protein